MSGINFHAEAFHSLEGSSLELLQTLVSLFAERPGTVRILDIGCSNGVQTLQLVGLLPNSQITGVDVSEVNIAAALKNASHNSDGNRAHFAVADFHTFHDGLWDGIFAESTLHLIPETPLLFTKITSDLADGGILVMTVPCRTFYNTILFAVRRMYRILGKRLVQNMALRLAKTVYPDIAEPILRERLSYMTVIPYFVFDDKFAGELRRGGLELQQVRRMPRILGKPDHCLAVFLKKPS